MIRVAKQLLTHCTVFLLHCYIAYCLKKDAKCVKQQKQQHALQSTLTAACQGCCHDAQWLGLSKE